MIEDDVTLRYDATLVEVLDFGYEFAYEEAGITCRYKVALLAGLAPTAGWKTSSFIFDYPKGRRVIPVWVYIYAYEPVLQAIDIEDVRNAVSKVRAFLYGTYYTIDDEMDDDYGSVRTGTSSSNIPYTGGHDWIERDTQAQYYDPSGSPLTKLQDAISSNYPSFKKDPLNSNANYSSFADVCLWAGLYNSELDYGLRRLRADQTWTRGSYQYGDILGGWIYADVAALASAMIFRSASVQYVNKSHVENAQGDPLFEAWSSHFDEIHGWSGYSGIPEGNDDWIAPTSGYASSIASSAMGCTKTISDTLGSGMLMKAFSMVAGAAFVYYDGWPENRTIVGYLADAGCSISTKKMVISDNTSGAAAKEFGGYVIVLLNVSEGTKSLVVCGIGSVVASNSVEQVSPILTQINYAFPGWSSGALKGYNANNGEHGGSYYEMGYYTYQMRA